MKKIVAIATMALMMLGSIQAQNTFKGIIKYKLESTGQVAMQIPEEAATAEIRVSGNDMFTKSPIFCGGMTECVLVQNMVQTSCVDYSGLLNYLRQNDFEFTYEGSGKLLMKTVFDPATFDTIEQVDTEPGHFYYEYLDGETKQIAGITAKKMIRHAYDEDGEEHQMIFWYSDEIGPKLNVLFGGLRGMPLECTIDQGEGRAITYTATEVVKGKVKDSEFLLPYGYDTLSDDELQTLGEELQEAIELLQGE